MIVNSWKNTVPMCGFCNEPMRLNITRSGFQYECDKCHNYISDRHFERMLDIISDMEDEMFLAKKIGVLTDKDFVVAKKIKCHIIEDKGNGEMSISIKNMDRK